jgi:hypothetical protein
MANLIGSIGSPINLLIKQGSDFGPVTEILTNPDGSPVNLTDAILRGQIRKSGNDAALVADLAIEITDAPNGVFTWGLSNAVTELIPAGESVRDKASSYVWDMELVDSIGRVIPLHYGSVSVFREVTRV